MNSLIRYLTFRATRPTHFYEGQVYMSARLLLGALTFFTTVAASPSHGRYWPGVSLLIAIAGARAAQTVRSGANRREEAKTLLSASDPKLPCEADLKRAAAIGSLCTSLAPAVALGSAISGAWVGVLGGWALAASVLAGLQSAFDVAWSAWIYPAWRRRYTTERDALRTVQARVDWEKNGRFVLTTCKGCGGKGRSGLSLKVVGEAERVECSKCGKILKDRYGKFESEREEDERDETRQIYVGSPIAYSLQISADGEAWQDAGTNEPEDAPTELMTRPRTLVGYDGCNLVRYERCDSLDDLLARVAADIAEVGTRLYLNDDSPVVERGKGGWFVDWLDGTTSPVFLLSEGKERERFLAMAEGRET